MKKFKFLAGAAALLAVGFASCSDDKVLDEPVNNGPQVAETDQTQYLCVEITSPREGAKGKAFDDGTTNESAVTRLDFIFYDVTGKPTGKPQTFVEADLKAEDFGDDGYEDGNVTRIWTSVVPVELVQGANLPAQVICLVNARADRATLLANKNIDDIRDEKITLFSNGDDFMMTNSVYFGLNELTGQANQRLCATPIARGQLFESRKKAEEAITGPNADEAALVNIYVERLAAKVGLTMAADAPKPYTLANGGGEGDVTLTFVPDYWFMNATANENYITKRYGVPDATGTGINLTPTYDQINTNFANTGMATTWNAPTLHRSYWGCSPSYNENSFPMVSDQVDDLEGNKTAYPQKYYTYKEVVAQATDAIAAQAIAAADGSFTLGNTGAKATGYIYTRETTTAISRIRDVNGNPAATIGSAVLLGHYVVDGAAAAETFYVDRNAGEKGTYYSSANAAKAVLASRQAIVFTDIAGTTPAGADQFTLAHPNAATRAKLANQNLAGRLVTIQLDEVPTQALYYYDNTLETPAFVPVDEDNLAQVNAELVTAGYMDMFYNGIAFFSIPIRHLGFNETICMANGTYLWDKMRVGDLGIVRNHVYSLTVNSISGLGTGVRSEDQPIVPPVTQMNQYVAARLNILAWNVVNPWGVDL